MDELLNAIDKLLGISEGNVFDYVHHSTITLMWKNIPVIVLDREHFTVKVLDTMRLPYGVRSIKDMSYVWKGIPLSNEEIHEEMRTYDKNRSILYRWISDRSITLSRANAKWVYNALNMRREDSDAQCVLIGTMCRSVALSDNYWLKLSGDNYTWEDVNIRSNPLEAVLPEITLHAKSGWFEDTVISPELTTDGTCPKCWRRYKDNSLWLHKASYPFMLDSARRDVVVSNLLGKTNADHVPYVDCEDKGIYVSACPLMSSDSLSIMTAYEFKEYCKCNSLEPFEEMRKIDSDSIDVMTVVDFLVGNRDRHSRNWGFMYDSDTMKILKCFPLFDHNNTFATEILADESIEYRALKRPFVDCAKEAIERVDFHFTKEVSQKDFLNVKHYETFMQRANELGIKVIPEKPNEMLLRLTKRALLCVNRYDMLDAIMDEMPRVGSEMSEADIQQIVSKVVADKVPKIIINN